MEQTLHRASAVINAKKVPFKRALFVEGTLLLITDRKVY